MESFSFRDWCKEDVPQFDMPAEEIIQGLSDEIDSLRAEVERLRARNERLEASLKALGVIECQEDTNGEWVPNPAKK